MAVDAVIVGAGVVGAACADALTSAGLSVAVLESRFAASGATAAAMGHIVVMDDSDAQFALTRLSRDLWEELAAEMPRACEDERTGTLWIAADRGGDGSRAAQGDALPDPRRRGRGARSSAALEKAEPNLRPGLAGALRVPGDRVVYPIQAARWLLGRAVRRGARFVAGAEASVIGPRRVVTPTETFDAQFVVNAAGTAAPLLTPGLPVAPRKGHLVITDRYPGFCRHQLVELGYLSSAHGASAESVAFNLQPRSTGQVLLGSSREFVGFDPAVNRRIRDRMIRRALEFVPALAGLSAIRTWTGFRPATPDNLPLIGFWPATEGLSIAAGHEGLGITTALGTARLIADAMLGRASPIDPKPYLPTRPFSAAHA